VTATRSTSRRASEEEGLRATTAVDGEVVVIEAHAVVEPGVTDDGAAFDDEYLVATITGARASGSTSSATA
jgi:hypothetical protein